MCRLRFKIIIVAHRVRQACWTFTGNSQNLSRAHADLSNFEIEYKWKFTATIISSDNWNLCTTWHSIVIITANNARRDKFVFSIARRNMTKYCTRRYVLCSTHYDTFAIYLNARKNFWIFFMLAFCVMCYVLNLFIYIANTVSHAICLHILCELFRSCYY